MPTTFKSPYSTSFKSAVKRGTPCSVAVEKIAKRNNKTTTSVWNSLYKAGVCDRQKFNGKWIYWPAEGGKGNSTNWKPCQTDMWQNFVDWCVCSGTCTPQQLSNNTASQKAFMTYCKKFWGKQFNGTSTTTNGRKGTTRKNGSTTSYRFSTSRRKAA